MENTYKPLSKIAGEKLKRIIKEKIIEHRKNLHMPSGLKRERSADGLTKVLKISTRWNSLPIFYQ